MSQVDLDFGPSTPMSRKDMQETKDLILVNGFVVENRFNEWGRFGVLHLSQLTRPNKLSDGVQLWSQRLLELCSDRENFELRLEPRSYRLILKDKVRGKDSKVSLSQIRYVDEEGSGMKTITESGYLLSRDETYDEYAKALELASAGKNPGLYNNSEFVRVLGGNVGQEVMFIDLTPIRYGEALDGVVIDPETKKLIRRKFETPLSFQRWGVTPPLRDHLFDFDDEFEDDGDEP